MRQPQHHQHPGGGVGKRAAGGKQRSGHVGAVHKKPHPPSKAHKKPNPPAKPKKPPARKPVRKWSPGWDVSCCTAEAVGMLLGLSDAEVLALYWLTASDPDEGASIEDTLDAAGPRSAAGLILGVTLPEPHAVAVTPDGTWWSWGEPFNPYDWPQLVIEEAWCLP